MIPKETEPCDAKVGMEDIHRIPCSIGNAPFLRVL